MSQSLVSSDYVRAAQTLGCAPAVVMAVAEVEAPCGGFVPDGRPTVLFEAHIFARETQHRYDVSHPQISSRRWNRSLYRDGVGEHERLAAAAKLDRDAALRSASWGRFQIMGFNHALAGHRQLQDFVNAMSRDEGAQLDAFVAYVQARRLDDALQRHDWARFAHGYNGPDYARNRYDERLRLAYQRCANASRPTPATV